VNAFNEPVSLSGQRFDVAGPVGRISQHLPEPVHGPVQAVFEIDESAATPKLLLEFIPANDRPRLQ
jgi:hypothetical protein